MGRKNLLSDLLSDAKPAAPSAPPAEEGRAPHPTLGGRGVVGAMSRSLERLTAESEAARALADRFANGETVLEIDPSLIDASIVPDRMPGTDEEHEALVQSISANGQLVPVLLRPHPSQPARYQTAYGHRRVRALKALGRPVRAVIRRMTDEELVVAQGKENGERKDLSFIERAVYAVTLEDREFKRDTIGSALSVDKTELSRLISVGRAIPRALIEAIGPAPKTGRRRWMELEALLQGKDAIGDLAPLISNQAFRSKGSDARFLAVCAALAPRPQRAEPESWTSADGKAVASIDRKTEKTTLAVNEKVAPGFGEFVVGRLGELYVEYLKGTA
ncbi:ParB family chromosome partitioning protein [Bradyrhizobium sp. USDA 4448]